MSGIVSIVTPLYNYAHYLGDLLESVQKQSYSNWEHIIIDDGSTDSPEKVIQQHQDKRIRYVRFSTNKGYSFAKNEGIVRSRGSYIVMIDADDMLTENSLEIRKKLLDNNPKKLWCHGEALVLKKNGFLSHCSRNFKRRYRQKLKKEGKNLKKEYFLRLVHAQTVMVRPGLHKKLGLYDESLKFSSDREMWERIISFGHIPVHTDDFVSIYRTHGNQMHKSEFKKKQNKKVKDRIKKLLHQRLNEGITKENTRLWI